MTALMEVIKSKIEMRKWSRYRRLEGKTIALVPTMGYLHDGHLSLVKEAFNHANFVVVSIYINPAQFSVNEDLSTYPHDISGDIQKLMPLGVNAVFNPYNLYESSKLVNEKKINGNTEAHQNGEILKITEKNTFDIDFSAHETWINVENLQKPLEGTCRPVFFQGVATVVAKLFHIVEPDVAVFGKKDFQQWRVITRMVRDLDFAVEIIGAPLVREKDGLAMSSRNVYLSPNQRFRALSISKALFAAEKEFCSGVRDSSMLIKNVMDIIENSGCKIDYVQIVDKENLQCVNYISDYAVLAVAIKVDNIRLIDNIELNSI